MKRHHLFGLYCALLVPIGVLVGLSLGRVVGRPALSVVLGAVVGVACSRLLLRGTAPHETP